MKPRVFIPQVPSRFDRDLKMWVPTVNLEPAKAYGEIVELLPPNANRAGIAPLVGVLRQRMQSFTCDDWLLASGDPSLIAAASVIAARATGGKLNMLKWDRVVSDYIAVELDLF